MKESTERLIVHSLLKNNDFYLKAGPFIKSEYFGEKDAKLVFDAFEDFNSKYAEVPSATEIRTMLSEVHLDDDVERGAHEILDFEPSDEINLEWMLDTAEDYCRRRATYLALLKSLDIVDGKSKEPMTSVAVLIEAATNLKFDLDLGLDFYEDVDKKLESYEEDAFKIPWKLGMLNKITNGGFEKKTVNCVAAPTGFGKSIFLGDEAVFQSQQGRNCAYITFEMSDRRIDKRLNANLQDTMLHEIEELEKTELKKRFEQYRDRKHGFLMLKEFGPGEITAAKIGLYIKELERSKGEKIDIVFIDYINLMASARYSANNGTYLVLKGICEELVALAKRLDIVIITATQFNRGGQKNSSPELRDISESQAISNTVDFLLALFDTEELEKKMMLVAKQLKNRYGDKNWFKTFLLGIERAKMKFFDVSEEESKALVDNIQTPEVEERPVFERTKTGKLKLNNFDYTTEA